MILFINSKLAAEFQRGIKKCPLNEGAKRTLYATIGGVGANDALHQCCFAL
jgi:hypothetical protein